MVLGPKPLELRKVIRVLKKYGIIYITDETFEKCSILPAQLNLLKFNRGSSSRQVKILTTPINYIGTGIHTLSILRIALKVSAYASLSVTSCKMLSLTQAL